MQPELLRHGLANLDLAKPIIVIGIDPGVSGAVAFVRLKPEAVKVFDMPITIRRRGTSKKEVHAEALAQLVKRFTAGASAIAIVEKVHGMVYRDATGNRRGQGAAPSFNFGRSYGVALGVLAALGVRTMTVKPAIWKTTLGLSKDKALSVGMARHLFPTLAEDLLLIKDGRSEALLLTHFFTRHLK